MKTASIPTLGNLLVEDTWNEQASKVFCLFMDNLSTQQIQVSQPEASDFSSAEAVFDTFGDNLKTWIDGAVNSSSEGTEPIAFDPSYLPDIATFIALLVTQQWGAIFMLFVKIGFQYLVDSTRKRLDPATSSGDIVELLRQTIAVTDENGDIVGCKLEGLADLQIKINNIISQGEAEALYSVIAKQE